MNPFWTKNQSLLHKNAPEDNYKLHRKVFREIRSNLKMFDSNQSLKSYLIFKIIIDLLNYHYSLPLHLIFEIIHDDRLFPRSFPDVQLFLSAAAA